MYGLVNRAIEDLVVSIAGAETWKRIRAEAGVEDLQLLDTTNYSDDITYRLVASASEVLELSAEDVLHAFGRHWVLYTGREGWANLFAASGDDFVDFLRNLDEMHSRVNTAMPDGRMPEFTLLAEEGRHVLEYRSDREGLAPMVVGILSGLAEQFGESWSIEHVGLREEHGFDRFHLTRVALPHSDELHDAA